MIIVGLTGKIACGKSTAAAMFKELGAEIIDADEIARTVVYRGKPAWKKIVEHFGEYILDNNGLINRKKLGQMVFNDNQKLKDLMDITHPEILKELKGQIESLKEKGAKCVIIEATLIEEEGVINHMIDKLILVKASKENQVSRLLIRNNHSIEECMQRINAQSSEELRVIKADYTIQNDSDFTNLNMQVLDIWNDLLYS